LGGFDLLSNKIYEEKEGKRERGKEGKRKRGKEEKGERSPVSICCLIGYSRFLLEG